MSLDQRRVAPLSYFIEVCRYCGAEARRLGCPHWQKHVGWTTVIRVKPTPADRAALQQAMDEAVAARDEEQGS